MKNYRIKLKLNFEILTNEETVFFDCPFMSLTMPKESEDIVKPLSDIAKAVSIQMFMFNIQMIRMPLFRRTSTNRNLQQTLLLSTRK